MGEADDGGLITALLHVGEFIRSAMRSTPRAIRPSRHAEEGLDDLLGRAWKKGVDKCSARTAASDGLAASRRTQMLASWRIWPFSRAAQLGADGE